MLQLNYAKWMQDTDLGFGKIRSSQLKALDEAIKAYGQSPTPQNATKVYAALQQWESSRNTDRPTERDRKGAVTALKAELKKAGLGGPMAFQIATFSAEELQALRYMAEQRRRTLQVTFAHADVVFVGKKPDPSTFKSKLNTALSVAKAEHSHKSKTASQGSSGGGGTVQQVMTALKEELINLVSKFFEVSIAALGAIGDKLLDLVTEIAARVAPFVGHLLDAKNMIKGWVDVGVKAHARYDIGKRHYAIATGAPKAAFEALTRCMTEDLQQTSLVAANATLSFAAKTGLAFVDGGAVSGVVVGIASALAELARVIYLWATEWKATTKLKALLANPSKLDLTVFETYPLMGAYLLRSATFSDLVPITMFGMPGWMDVIENRKSRDFDAMYEKAGELIQGSAFEIVGLPKRADVLPGLKTKFNFVKGAAMPLTTALVQSFI